MKRERLPELDVSILNCRQKHKQRDMKS